MLLTENGENKKFKTEYYALRSWKNIFRFFEFFILALAGLVFETGFEIVFKVHICNAPR